MKTKTRRTAHQQPAKNRWRKNSFAGQLIDIINFHITWLNECPKLFPIISKEYYDRYIMHYY